MRRARPLLGTVVHIRVSSSAEESRVHAAIDAAFASIERVQQLMSYHEHASDLSRLNRDALQAPQQVDPHTYRVLATALEMAALSEGAFDPCVGARLERWQYLPAQEAAAEDGCWRDIELLEDRQVRFRRALRVDLGGIAKGYAVDGALELLQALGFEQVLVNAGGDLRIGGTLGEDIGVRDPRRPTHVAQIIALHDAALATSAAYFSRRVFDGEEVCALLDPRDGRALAGDVSVSVKAARCLHADALTKVVLFASNAIAERALEHYRAEAFLSAAR